MDLDVAPATLTVVTGRIGSGKTTLLRALLGLLPAQAGTIEWNGRVVADAARYLVPPRVGYVPQRPGLFSDSLADNVALGWAASSADLDAAVCAAVLDRDLAELDNSMRTRVGPRGIKLSGGQIQRTAAARALLRQPQLLVVDDVSSALDVETERELWDRLLGDGRLGVLAVSHRRLTLRHADRIVVMNRGRVDAVGSLDELLQSSAELRSIWEQGSVDQGAHAQTEWQS